MEMYVLSFSDKLMTSEYSSFGYIPAGLAGLRPYLMNIGVHMHNTDWKRNGRSVCGLGSVEPCYPEMRGPLMVRMHTLVKAALRALARF